MATHNLCTFTFVLILIAAQASVGEAGIEISSDDDDFKDWLQWEPSEEIRQLYPMYRIGTDKDGSAVGSFQVYVKEIGKWRLGKLEALSKEKQAEFWKYYEKLVRLQERDAKLSSGSEEGNLVIYDFDGFDFNHNVSLDDLEILFKQFAYLERESAATKKGFLINGARPFLDYFLKKFEAFDGAKMSKWRGRLLEYIPADQLPVKYGGSKSSNNYKNNWCG